MTRRAWLGKDDRHLVAINGSHRLLPEVVEDFNAMQQAAFMASQDIQIVSSYRSFEKQLSIWNRKWQGELPLYDREGKQLNTRLLSDEEKTHAILIWSALPGGSRHHWGTDLDVYDRESVKANGGHFDLIDAEYREGGPCFKLAQWMTKNLSKFGFSRPFLNNNGGVATELWHLSHLQSSKRYERQRSIEELYTALSSAPISGKACILRMLEELYFRYVLNQGIKQ